MAVADAPPVDGAPQEAVVTDEAQVEALVDDLEASYEWRDGAPAAVRELLALLPEGSAAEVQRARLNLLLVDDLVRERGSAGAAVAIVEIRDRAATGGHRALQARAERVLSRHLRKIGDISAGLEHAVAALALDGDDLAPTLRWNLRTGMSDALSESGSFDEGRSGYREALEMARALGAPWCALQVLNNWAYTELLAGDLEAAWGLAERLRAQAAVHAVPLTLVYTGTVAEILHARGRSEEAIAMLREHLGLDHPHVLVDAAGCWLTLAQIERESGDLDAADASLSTAERLTTAHGLHGLHAEAVGSRAELLAARGDHAGAYERHLRFHDQTLALRSAAADARAQTQHAVLAADTARRDAARYRQMSSHDPLTGLLNRRHLDADLDARLDRGETLAIAMVDLDHFKAVNDTFSHEAGDAVLVRVAALLVEAAAAAAGAWAARLGGEEFLLVLPGHDLTAAHAVAERLRRTIATTDWSDIAPGLPITASTGLATTPDAGRPPPDRADLLRTADRHLYAAKAGGRDRVEPAPPGDLKQPGRDADGRPWPPTRTRPPVR